VEIPKPDGQGVRKLGIACVLDRFVQQAVLQVLQKRWDPTFSEHSHGFRPGRSAQQAVHEAQQYIAEGYRRYADDCNIYVGSERAGLRVMESVTRFITHHLKLKVNQAKSAVARPGQRKFLGFSFTDEREPRRRIAPKALARFKERVREQTQRTRGISLPQMVQDLTTYLRGWLGYFGDCQTPSVLHSLETWLRRRLRSVVWKQWKRGRTRFRELGKRGVSKDLAAKTAGSPHGPWRLVNSPALTLALPNAYFVQLGLPPLVVRS
jgi:RNA-directed DNA polymerase